MAHHRLVRQVSEHSCNCLVIGGNIRVLYVRFLNRIMDSAVPPCDCNVVEDISVLNIRMIIFILLVGVNKVALDDVLVDRVFFFHL